MNEQRPAKKLYRSSHNRIIGGVCGGIADYFNTDPTWIRLLFIILLVAFGSTLIIYLILWIIVPEEPPSTSETSPPPPSSH